MPQKINADETAVYQITVQGCLNADWSAYLGDLIIATNEMSSQTTTLTGPLIDQAALMGVLNNLYNLGFYILAVSYQPQIQTEKNHV